jgi:protein-L-isoaspartate(D-aspartate) O-methyltransferase
MVDEQIVARGIRDPEVIRALRVVPRHLFVDSTDAYADRALPLPADQTISQPFVVALMTAAARPAQGWAGARVLEIGTGSGYQAAVLAELGASVISVERHPRLAAAARSALTAAGYDRVRVLDGDGTMGVPEGAPYDAILVTAAAPFVPPPLVDELADGGRLVMPVGGPEHQWLTVVVHSGETSVERRLEPVAFVPLIGAYGVSRPDVSVTDT